MGIKGLKRVIADNVPEAIKENVLPSYFNRTIAIDASMFLYSFLVAIRSGEQSYSLTDANGETTSHLQGLFNRTIRLLECGIRPVYVFDGKPPKLKSGELAKRGDRKRHALDKLEEAQESGNDEDAAKWAKQTVKVTRVHNEESKKLLRLLGVPVVEAPTEAEAQCAELCKKKKVWGTATEDMDALTLGTPLLLRHLTLSESRKIPIHEINLEAVLIGLEFTMDQFIDLCILLGCDYSDSIRGIGPKRAVELIRKHKNIETVIENLDPKKYTLPEPFPYVEARELFKAPEVDDGDSFNFEWKDPDEDALIEYLVKEKNFSEQRIRNALARVGKGKLKASQNRIDSFFTVLPKSPRKKTTKSGSLVGSKRKRGYGVNTSTAKRARR